MPRANKITIGEIVAKFLVCQKRQLAPNTYNWYKGYLLSFHRRHGAVPVATLTGSIVSAWVAKYPTASQHAAARCVVRVMNWAVAERLIPSSPLVGFRKPAPTKRETTVTPAQYAACLRTARYPLKIVIKFLWHTGARPQELRCLNYDWLQDNRVVLPLSRSKGNRKRRVIYLDDMALRIVQQHRPVAGNTKHGPIFQNSESRPWTKNNLSLAFRRLGKRVGIPGLCAYSFRHAFITRLLERGVDVATVAAIAGNSPRMVLDTYSHVAKNETRLAAVLRGSASNSLVGIL